MPTSQTFTQKVWLVLLLTLYSCSVANDVLILILKNGSLGGQGVVAIHQGDSIVGAGVLHRGKNVVGGQRLQRFGGPGRHERGVIAFAIIGGRIGGVVP